MMSRLGTGMTVKSRGRGLGVEETAWLPGKTTATALIVRTNRTRLDTAREYVDRNKGTIPRPLFNANPSYKTGRWAARNLLWVVHMNVERFFLKSLHTFL